MPPSPSPNFSGRPLAANSSCVGAVSDRWRRADQASLVRAEYREMPELSLTCAQAQRLWQLDRDLAVAILDQLLCEGFLHLTTKGTYVRADGAVRCS